jgi:hypothetical protein
VRAVLSESGDILNRSTAWHVTYVYYWYCGQRDCLLCITTSCVSTYCPRARTHTHTHSAIGNRTTALQNHILTSADISISYSNLPTEPSEKLTDVMTAVCTVPLAYFPLSSSDTVRTYIHKQSHAHGKHVGSRHTVSLSLSLSYIGAASSHSQQIFLHFQIIYFQS